MVTLCSHAQAQDVDCNLDSYTPQAGLEASINDGVLTTTWLGARDDEVRVSFGINDGKPTMRELAIRQAGSGWRILGTDLSPEFRVVSGIRRVTQQQTEPLVDMGIELTPEVLDEIKWEAFWDAPLFTSDEPPLSHAGSIPAAEPYANHPGMPRSPDEITSATATFKASTCSVRTNGSRLEIVFPGVEAGIFSGYLQFDVFKGSNLIRQMLVAKTEHPAAAFRYEAGISGFPISDSSRIVWRDLVHEWQDYQFGSPPSDHPVAIKSANRLIAAELNGGAIAAFPPPHSFYWARESEQVLGYGWYQKLPNNRFAFGIRQGDEEEDPEFEQNFALYSARPGTWQRMPLFLYVSGGSGAKATQSVLQFTNGDRFKPLEGFKVMGAHYHVGLVKRLKEKGGFDHRLNDIDAMKAIGVNIYGVIDGARGPGRKDTGDLFLNDLAEYYEAARRQSDKDFLVMPNDENSTGGRKPFLGGHYDIMVSKPLFWRPERMDGQPLAEEHPEYGTVYNLGTPADMMAMASRENVIFSMPHPRSKRSTGFPDAIKDEPHFQHPNYFGLGYRWGMGIDASEIRLGEYRFLTLWDEANNWMVSSGHSPKFALAISEARSDIGHRGKPPWDDAYGMSPVNYLKIDEVPSVDDMSTVIDALKGGEYFVTSGEVLIPNWSINGSGEDMTIVADVEWTFPLEFVEVVWGDGETTDRIVVSTTDLEAFGSKRFEIPFNATGKKWVRFAAWDVATNGAMIQPVTLD